MGSERDAVISLRRRWIITVGILISIALGALAASGAGKSQRAQEDAVFLVSPSSANPGSGGKVVNPYLGFNDLKVLVKAVVSLVGSDTVQSLVRAQGGSGTYLFALSGDLTSPIATLSATAPTRERAIKTYTLALAQVQQATRLLQQDAGAPASSWVTVNPVGTPTQTTELATPKIKAGAYGVGAGIILTLIALLIDSVIASAQRRRRKTSGPSADPRLGARPTINPAGAPLPPAERPADEGQFEYPVTADR